MILLAILMFAALILIHELGHYLAAKAFGVTVHEFAIGMGPKLWGKRAGGTLFSLRALPIGGFVMLEGEETTSTDQGAFCNKPTYVRMIVLLAGVVMNILLGFVIFALVTSTADEVMIPIVRDVSPDSAAAKAGLMPGDELIKLGNESVHLVEDVEFFKFRNGGNPFTMTVNRNKTPITLNITPTFQANENRYIIGFNYTIIQNSLAATAKLAVYQTVFAVKKVVVSLGYMLGGKVSLEEISGPIGIVAEVEQAAKFGFYNLLLFVALISVNLGVMNILPVPALDGGRILFLLFEMATRKKLKVEYEATAHFIGFVVLMGLALLVAWSDINKIIRQVWL